MLPVQKTNLIGHLVNNLELVNKHRDMLYDLTCEQAWFDGKQLQTWLNTLECGVTERCVSQVTGEKTSGSFIYTFLLETA